jgi:hypothetical protein
MSRQYLGPLALGAVFLLGSLMMLAGGGAGLSGSSLSPASNGLLAARLYLESRGAAVELLDRPPDAAGFGDRTLVLAGPFQRPFDQDSLRAVGDHLRGGGRVVYAYSTGEREGHEEPLRENLGLRDPRPARDEAPLGPLAWRRFRQEAFSLEPTAESPLRRPLEVLGFERSPPPPAGSEILFNGGPRSVGMVYRYRLHRGEVLALPAPLLSNAELHRAGNADLLELVLAGGGEGIVFDEAVHGLARIEEAAPGARLGWNIFLLQVLLLYLAALWTLGRSFGPAWTEQIPSLGSAAAFFEQLGSLHQKYRHHQGAARSLIERSRALDPTLPAELGQKPVATGDDFLALAREVARHQHSRRNPT